MTHIILTPLEIAMNHFDWAEDDEAIEAAIAEINEADKMRQ